MYHTQLLLQIPYFILQNRCLAHFAMLLSILHHLVDFLLAPLKVSGCLVLRYSG